MKTIETHARAFFKVIIFSLGIVEQFAALANTDIEIGLELQRVLECEVWKKSSNIHLVRM